MIVCVIWMMVLDNERLVSLCVYLKSSEAGFGLSVNNLYTLTAIHIFFHR